MKKLMRLSNMEQLKFDLKEKFECNYKNYDWLIGNIYNLKIAFLEELAKTDLPKELRIDAEKRLENIEKGIDIPTNKFNERILNGLYQTHKTI